jgi:hypothetical protein
VEVGHDGIEMLLLHFAQGFQPVTGLNDGEPYLHQQEGRLLPFTLNLIDYQHEFSVTDHSTLPSDVVTSGDSTARAPLPINGSFVSTGFSMSPQ